MAKGRKPNLDLISAEERYGIKQRAGGDAAAEKRDLMRLTRERLKDRAKAEILELRKSGSTDTAAAEMQLRLTGDDFDPEWKDREFKDELRLRCQTDLFFLSRDVLGRDLSEKAHRPLCDLLVRKDPTRTLADQDAVKERNIMYPRGTFKTTFVTRDDAVQWTICFPNIRILFLGGEKGITEAVLGEYIDTFVVLDEPTRFQRLFPEFCITPRERYETKYTAPCRQIRIKEPTAMGNSIDSALSSWHYDLIKAFDVVNNENTQTVERMEKVRKNFYVNKKLLMTYGYLDNEGTRYNPNELHGERLSQTSSRVRNLVKPALWANTELPVARQHDLERMLRDPNVPSNEFRADDWELLFPEQRTADGRVVGLGFDALMSERGTTLDQFYAFCSQLLNDPTAASGDIAFTIEQMRAATIPATAIPREGIAFIWNDLAYSTKRGRDFTVIPVGWLDRQGRIFIREIVRGRFVTHDLVYHMVDVMRRWVPEISEVEDSMGAKWLLSDLERKAQELGVPLRMSWVPIDNSSAAKDGRVKGCETAIHEGRLFFSSEISCIDDLYREFVGYGRETHDDIPDAIGQLVMRHLPRTMENPAPIETEEVHAMIRERELHEYVHGMGPYEPEPEMPPPDPLALEEICPGLNCG